MRAVATSVIRGSITCAILVRMSREVMVGPRLICAAGARMAGSILMMPKRHALSCHHRGHALQRHDQRNEQCKKPNEP